jgi:flagellar biosynthetic protein FliQ
MNDADVIQIAIQTMLVTAKVCAPILIVSLAVGFVISLLQSVTQIQEVTLSFVPKLAAVAVVIVISGNWMLQELTSFTRSLFDLIPQLLS